MKKRNFLFYGTIGLFLLNKVIDESAKKRHSLSLDTGLYHTFKDYEIYYTKKGQGSPVLLLHDLNPVSSGYEFRRLEKYLTKHHTVYTIDLLGCGRSEKPRLTYTNYLYVSLVTDFIKNVIGEKASLIVSHETCSVAFMVKSISPELIDQMVLINPAEMKPYRFISSRENAILKMIYFVPIFGTSLYNFMTQEVKMREELQSKYFYNPVTRRELDAFYESAHLRDSYGRFLYASRRCNYLDVNLSNIMEKFREEDILILIGDKNKDHIMNQYGSYLNKATFQLIENTKLLPHYEEAEEVGNIINDYLR